jgi:hypothetical protein
MSLNGYAWVEGNAVNRTDPSGSCPENPGPLDVFGWRCRFLAEGLAARTGSPVENFMWMDYGQLELLTGLGTLVDASILPSLALREDPNLVLRAIQEFNCQTPGTAMSVFGVAQGTLSRGGLDSAASQGSGRAGRTGRIGAVIVALQLGIGIGIGALLGVNSLVRTRENEEEDPEDVLFGQRRISAISRHGNIYAVSEQLESGTRLPDDLSVEAFRHYVALVTTNNRTLATLSLAGLRPTNITLRQPTPAELRRLGEDSIEVPPHYGIPGNRIQPPSRCTAVTPSQEDLTVLDVICIPP